MILFKFQTDRRQGDRPEGLWFKSPQLLYIFFKFQTDRRQGDRPGGEPAQPPDQVHHRQLRHPSRRHRLRRAAHHKLRGNTTNQIST